MSRQPLATARPQSNKAMLVVPPPMSRLTAVQLISWENCWAPLPLPAMMASRSGPAVETTNSPAKPLSFSSTRAEFSFRALSPVMITAPVSVSAGVYPAFWNSPATSSRTRSPSIRLWFTRGVVWISPR